MDYNKNLVYDGVWTLDKLNEAINECFSFDGDIAHLEEDDSLDIKKRKERSKEEIERNKERIIDNNHRQRYYNNIHKRLIRRNFNHNKFIK